MHRWITLAIFLASVVAVSVAPASAQVVTNLNFDTVPPDVECGEVWVEDQIDLFFTSTTSEDCDGGGNCSFGVDDGTLWLFPARLMVDFGEPYLIYDIEIDVTDNCGSGCTRAFAYNGGVQVASAENSAFGTEVLVLDVGSGIMVDSIAISSCEGAVLNTSIRIVSEVVPTESESWGGVKSLFK